MTDTQVLIGVINAKQQLKALCKADQPVTIEAWPMNCRFPSSFVTLRGKPLKDILKIMIKVLDDHISVCYSKVVEDEERR